MTREGGVGIFARGATCPGLMEPGTSSNEAQMLHEQARYKRGVIPIKVGSAEYGLHIACLHNDPSPDEASRALKEKNHARVLEDACRMGKQPVLLCMDTNMSGSWFGGFD